MGTNKKQEMKKKEIKTTTAPTEKRSAILDAAGFKVKPIKAPRKKYNRQDYYLKQLRNFTLSLLIGGVFFCAFAALRPSGGVARANAAMARANAASVQAIASSVSAITSSVRAITSSASAIVSPSRAIATSACANASQSCANTSPARAITSSAPVIASPVCAITSSARAIAIMAHPFACATIPKQCRLIYNDLTYYYTLKQISNSVLGNTTSQRYKLPLPQV